MSSSAAEFLRQIGQSPIAPWLTFAYGLIVGSFLNVCILRIPADQSIVHGSSRCTSCLKPLKWFHNIPVVSWTLLRGKCAFCSARISVQYPLVELATGLLFLWLFHRYGWSMRFLAYAAFCSSLLAISVIDLHLQIIPDELSLSGIVLGFLASIVVKDVAWTDSLLGILLGGGMLLAIAFGYEKLAGREGLGGGDIKLLGMIGAWLGYESVLVVVVISSFLGVLVGLPLMAFQRKDFKMAIPFGPFLAVAALIYLGWGDILGPVFFGGLRHR